jgi:putative oxidoreductase
MPVLRAVARPLLASIFVVQGFDAFRHPEKHTEKAEPVIRPLAQRVPAIPAKPEQAVRLNAAVQVVAGTMLALGRLPRLSALALAASLVPTTAAGHQFWAAEDPKDRAQQRIHFLKNASMLGGLLIAAGDTAGQPSLAWRGRNAARTARREVKLARRTARVSSKAGAQAGRASSRLPSGLPGRG